MSKLLLVIFVFFCHNYIGIQCKCTHSFVTLCDDLMDLEKEPLETWYELIIGLNSNKSPDEMYTIDYNIFPLDRFWKVTTLMILGQIKDIRSNTFYIDPEEISLENLKFYGNNIKRLRANTFDSLELRTLSFVKNNLDFIHKDAFYNCKIDTLDFSQNNLEIIENEVFNDERLNNSTKELIIRHNKIELIEPNSLPKSLEILNLDYNKLSFIKVDLFHDLTNLQELTLSHNQLSQIPDFRPLKQLQELVLSHNLFELLHSEYLSGLTQLEILDLSYNKMYQSNILNNLKFREKGLATQISLAFNRFTQMQLFNQTLGNDIIILYGNPWNCKCWEKIEKFIIDNHFKRHKCDLEYFGTGQTPYCLYFDDNNIDCNKYLLKQYLTEEDYKGFMNVIETNKKNIDCNLSVKRM